MQSSSSISGSYITDEITVPSWTAARVAQWFDNCLDSVSLSMKALTQAPYYCEIETRKATPIPKQYRKLCNTVVEHHPVSAVLRLAWDENLAIAWGYSFVPDNPRGGQPVVVCLTDEDEIIDPFYPKTRPKFYVLQCPPPRLIAEYADRLGYSPLTGESFAETFNREPIKAQVFEDRVQTENAQRRRAQRERTARTIQARQSAAV